METESFSDLLQVAAEIDRILQCIHAMHASDPELSRKSQYKLQEKGQAEKSRFAGFLQYTGPDNETLKLLELLENQRLSHSLQFWTFSPIHPAAGSGDPQVYLCGLTEIDQNTIRETASMLSEGKGYDPTEKARRTLVAMTERGAKYKFLEQALGRGISLVLGTTLSESHWLKLLPKDGKGKFSQVKEHLDTTNVLELSEKFNNLQLAIMTSMASYLTSSMSRDGSGRGNGNILVPCQEQ
ncbi:hypothetical protein K431DRAFT_342846 [Polychaeton citri CBS 116435]|uniref:Uncharacterized protein n=1 Tax=Polychaeton citri CBS 116435 TaxID=1314669 RepID=A0A9P4QGZ9_9PEZI|nr:hypothetical protein K431DRAFT_342846 [Polychaeton citri CBS 116435]